MASDRPFIYVLNGSDLIDGPRTNSLVVDVDNDADTFHLRRVVGAGSIADTASGARWTLYDMDGRAINSDLGYTPPDFAAERMMVPESIYTGRDRSSHIRSRITQILRRNRTYPVVGSAPNYVSDIYFQGVKRFNNVPPYRTGYEWSPVPWDIPFTTAMWAGRQAPAYQVEEPARRFNVPVEFYDWDFYGITLTLQSATDADLWIEPVNQVKLLIYDSDGNALMNLPVLDYALNMQSTYAASIFPCPPITYQANSVLKFELTSCLINTEVPANLNITFHGNQRVPC